MSPLKLVKPAYKPRDEQIRIMRDYVSQINNIALDMECFMTENVLDKDVNGVIDDLINYAKDSVHDCGHEALETDWEREVLDEQFREERALEREKQAMWNE